MLARHPDNEGWTKLTLQGGSEYAAYFWVGTPAQMQVLHIDTGSRFTWLQCKPCPECHKQNLPVFDPSKSITYDELPCNSSTCKQQDMDDIFQDCTKGSCKYFKGYGDNSISIGTVVSESLTFILSNIAVSNFVMGCGLWNEGLFSEHITGILGLGRGPFSLQNQMNATGFSLCLISPTSKTTSSLNVYGSPLNGYGNTSIVVPLRDTDQRYSSFYLVEFTGIAINGWTLDIPSKVWGFGYDGGVVIDTGSTLTYFPTDAYKVFRLEIERETQNLTRKPSEADMEFCYMDDPLNVYPVIELYFENGSDHGEFLTSLTLTKEQMLWKLKGKVCLAFAEEKGSARTTIGNHQLYGTRLTFDLKQQVLVFTPNDC
ncbi:Protein ASPARTIC PROTEASE IN GUARD CELL 1-like [Quillaja saponaria]|uniref:Protein ASPARTIC PROTEASE IN GUARD CELL 1-like n=1 Tax=Quillaja saponaria TaxID=32244 RepID=A0AAD7LEA6_QUISA|nr:Protein ASPARTIC PROTEASE IN GUARD CELL 1-like [Quillaja saponaria]